MSASDVLRQYDKQFADAEEASGGNDPLPDGTYQARVETARLVESKEQRRPMLEWELIVISGPYTGRREWLRQLLDNPNGYPFLKRNLRVCGVQLERLSDLPAVTAQGSLLDKCLEITIKSASKDGKDYRNVYFDRQLGSVAAQADDSGDSVPF